VSCLIVRRRAGNCWRVGQSCFILGIMTKKICSRCHCDKPVSEYTKNKLTPTGLDRYCRPCKRAMKQVDYQVRKTNIKSGRFKFPEVKTCSLCGVEKQAEFFNITVTSSDGLRSYCKGCEPDYDRQTKWAFNFGLTVEEYQALLNAQDGNCAICGGACPTGRMLAVDHDHLLGFIRGLLCARCNNALGSFQDSADLLLRAIQYLASPPAREILGERRIPQPRRRAIASKITPP
jgi:hypothetical protein